MLDFLGVTLGGATQQVTSKNHIIGSSCKTSDNISVIGMNMHADVLLAALMNGINAHELELDDGHRFGMIHPGATVISALLPWVIKKQLSGSQLLTGIIMGYEAAIKLASALQPGMKDKGYHATGTCGTIGAAMGAAFASGYSQNELKSTLAAACTSASGILETIRNKSELKPYNAGQAAANGLIAAMVGKAGFKGPDDILGGQQGFINVMGGKLNGDLFIATGRPAIESIYVKPYAACRHCHPPIEAIQKIREKHAVNPSDVSNIIVKTYRWAVHLHDHTEIQGITSAKMSTPYSVAVALVTGKAGMDEFTEKKIVDPVIQEITGRVKVFEDPELTAIVPYKRGAMVQLHMKDGTSFAEFIELPKGEPENPLSQQELIEKFTSLAIYAGKAKAECKQIIDITMHIETRLDELFDYL